MNRTNLQALTKPQIPQTAKQLTKQDIAFLVDTLTEKNDALRYNAFLLLQENSRQFPYTYEHWQTLETKLEDENSYQRSLGVMLLAENVRWDREAKFAKIFDKYLACCEDDKFVTARQAIQALAKVVEVTDAYDSRIKQGLAALALAKYKENQQRLLTKDVAAILQLIAKKAKKSKV
jgi:hypothetical protein